MATKIGKTEMASVAKRLNELRTTLPANEKRALDAIVANARGGDVQGFSAVETTVELDPILFETYQGVGGHDSSNESSRVDGAV